MTDLSELLAKVQAASGSPDKELAMEFAAAVLDGEWRPYSPKARSKWMFDASGGTILYGYEEAVRWFASVDAALALVERVFPGWPWMMESADEKSFVLWKPKVIRAYANEFGTTLPLAILAAMLSALIEKAQP